MTQISGKIYQMKNAAGTENRFPRTVMEAVLGLNTYLQQQFSALADIYMPIEGISEALTDQEFVYRISPASIKAKSLTLDRILGRTLAWNQYVKGTNVGASSSVTISNRTIDGFTATAPAGSQNKAVSDTIFNTVGHKYYVSFEYTSNLAFKVQDMNEGDIPMAATSNFVRWSKAGFKNQSVYSPLYWYLYGTTTEVWTLVVRNYMCVNLTLMFGAGNEPTTEEFEALYPGYHDYSAGKLISNDAEALESIGRNQWDEVWEFGSLSSTDGSKISSTTQIRSKNYIPVLPNTTYYRKNPYSDNGTGHLNRAAFYDANKQYLGGGSADGWIAFDENGTFTTPANAAYMLFYVDATTYANDICINLSDESFNGQYEPYRKSTLHLGLNNIRVKSHNIWDEDTESGYISNTGVETSSNTAIRSKNYFKCVPGATYYLTAPSGSATSIKWYDASKSFLDQSNQGAIVTAPSNAAYFRLSSYNYGSTTYNNDICINVSSSFNGQYEPHGILTIEGGLRSGSSYDGTTTVREEIVGNKYIKRFGKKTGSSFILHNTSSAAYKTYKTILDDGESFGTTSQHQINSFGIVYTGSLNSESVNYETIQYDASSGYTFYISFNPNRNINDFVLYYALNTPIEYELAEPLVPTVKAGTTEARISPNADGLSAPFRADITYSASENNDAATSQYAATAGRLINAQTIWGQSFDGSDSVSGAISGVTDISMAGAITGLTNINSGAIQVTSTGVGIGKAPNVKLDVNGVINATQCALRSTLPAALSLYNTAFTQNAVYAQFYMGNTKMGEIGYWSGTGAGMYMQTATSPSKTLTLLESGGVSYNGNTIYHSGNSNLNTVDWTCQTLIIKKGINDHNGYSVIDCQSDWNIFGASSLPSYLDGTYCQIRTSASVGYGGVRTPAYTLDVSGTFQATGDSLIGGTLGVTGATTLSSTLAVTGNTTLGGNLYVGTSASNKILSVYGDSNMMGKVYVGKDEASAPCFVLDADSQEGLKIKPDTAATNHYMHLSTGGVLTVTDGIVCNGYITAGASASSSDVRLKDNVSAISTDKALSILSSLRGAEWDWNEKSGLYGQHGSGLVAQEVQKVMPWAVLELNDKLSLNYNSLWGIAIPVIQDLVDRIHQLEEKVRELSKS